MKQPIIVLILLTLFLTSCERIFHEPEISIGVIENQEKLIEAAEGCWAKFIWAINYPDRSSYYYQNLKADDVTFRPCGYRSFYQNKTDCWYSTSADFTNYNQYSDYLYESLYLVIASVNNIISKFTDPAKEDQLTQEIIGEMLFLRAYCHFRLVRTYGQVPIVRDIEVKYNLNKPDFLQIYAFIESDLKQALSLLPLTSEASRIPGKRPTQAAAKTLLAEVYLHWAGYPIKDAEKYLFAAREAGELIENADYYGVGLMDDFAFLWDAEHSQNKELLFTLYFSDLDKVNSVDEINLMYMKKEPYYLYVHPW
ncbi:MAG TPA: hypothetical protein ENO18_00310, partial [Caldithrix sp.]|nr:hypothetical protein [Caldithrix sp.]